MGVFSILLKVYLIGGFFYPLKGVFQEVYVTNVVNFHPILKHPTLKHYTLRMSGIDSLTNIFCAELHEIFIIPLTGIILIMHDQRFIPIEK